MSVIVEIFKRETVKGWRDPELVNVFSDLIKNIMGIVI